MIVPYEMKRWYNCHSIHLFGKYRTAGWHKSKYPNRKKEYMNELYEAIEQKIKASGYPRAISGEDVYNDICDQIDGKENGTYLLLSKFEEDVVFEYHITIQDEDFNLGILTMRTPEGVFEADFDA